MDINKILLLTLSVNLAYCSDNPLEREFYGQGHSWDNPSRPTKAPNKSRVKILEEMNKQLKENNSRLDRERHAVVIKISELNEQLDKYTKSLNGSDSTEKEDNLDQKLKNVMNLVEEKSNNRYNVLEQNFDILNNSYKKFKICSVIAVVGSILTTALLMSEKVQNKIKNLFKKNKSNHK